jgi:hypothetical protein
MNELTYHLNGGLFVQPKSIRGLVYSLVRPPRPPEGLKCLGKELACRVTPFKQRPNSLSVQQLAVR